jgi:hypothetical protein
MSATPITAAKRYFAPEIAKINFLPACANKNSPTRSEINAGTDLTPDVSAINGWSVTSNLLDSPDYGSRFTSKTPGRTDAANSDLKFYASQDTVDVRELLPRDTTGFVVIMWGGDVPTQKCDVFPVKVSSNAKSLPDNADADITVSFAITSKPAEDVTIPA